MTTRALSAGYQRAAVARLKLTERATAVALLILLHAALLLLIHPQFQLQTAPPPLREITLSLHPPAARALPLIAIKPVFAKPAAPAITPPRVPRLNLPSVGEAPRTAPQIGGVGRSLFDCDLANSGNLPPDKPANCVPFGMVPPAGGIIEAGLPKNTKARHGTIWAAQLAARRAPVEAPCTSVQREVLGGPGVQKSVATIMADPLCLLNGLLNGFRPQPK